MSPVEPNNSLSISVVIPSVAPGWRLDRALASAYCQTYKPLEIIIVVDGPGEKPEWALPKNMQNARVIFTGKASSAANARNQGVHASRGEIIAFLDDDDFWCPHTLESYHRVFTLGAVATYCLATTGSSRRAGKVTRPGPDQAGFADMAFRTFINTVSAFAIRRSLWDKIGGFAVDLPLAEDLDYYLRILSIASISKIQEILVSREITGSGLTSRHKEWSRCLVHVLKRNMETARQQKSSVRFLLGILRRQLRLLLIARPISGNTRFILRNIGSTLASSLPSKIGIRDLKPR